MWFKKSRNRGQQERISIRRDIYNRAKNIYVIFFVIGLAFVSKIIYLQYSNRGEQLRKVAMSDKNFDFKKLPAKRGDILTYDDKILATTIPLYYLFMDFKSDGLDSLRFYSNVDSLAKSLATFYGDKPYKVYADSLRKWYKMDKGNRYKRISPRRINYIELKKVLQFPLYRDGRYKSGLMLDTLQYRMLPFGDLAKRTIGGFNLSGRKWGLEGAADTILTGNDGSVVMQKVSGSFWIPIESDQNVEPIDGCDVMTTIDIEVQAVAENMLKTQLEENDANWGTAILIETATGEVRAMANLGKKNDGTYADIYNYAIGQNMEPGSTFKLVSLMALLEDAKFSINSMVDCGSGSEYVSGAKVNDVKRGGYGTLPLHKVFQVSSNVGFARSIYRAYGHNPGKFSEFMYKRNFDKEFNFEIAGEAKPVIRKPGDKFYSGRSLPMMAYGYELLMTPLHTVAIYNSVANGGTYVTPYIIKGYKRNGQIEKIFTPDTLCEKVCSDRVIEDIRRTMEDVVNDGTAKVLLNPNYRVAGKTGTSQVSKGKLGYHYNGGRNYLATVVGYFPAENPKYSCIVAIETFRPDGSAKKYYGGSLAGPVFRAIADKVYSQAVDWGNKAVKPTVSHPIKSSKPDIKFVRHSLVVQGGIAKDIRQVFKEFNINVALPESEELVSFDSVGSSVIKKIEIKEGIVPSCTGVALSDAVYTLYKLGYNVKLDSIGRIYKQVPEAGTALSKGDTVMLFLK